MSSFIFAYVTRLNEVIDSFIIKYLEVTLEYKITCKKVIYVFFF